MTRRSRGLAVAVLLTFTAGCFGSFNLTRKLWGFNDTVSPNKAVKELVFLALVIIPVYEVCSLGDALIFNTIEFWGGKNPISQNMKDGPREAIARRTPEGMKLEIREAGKPTRTLDFEVGAQGAVVREDGRELMSVFADDGSARVRDGSGATVLVRDAAELRALSAALEESPAAFVATLDRQEAGVRLAAAR